MIDSTANVPIRILIGSVGRRLYLIDWFEEALHRLDVVGEVHVTEADEHSAGYLRASHRHLMPPYADPSYESAMCELFERIRPDLFFSVNDFELNMLSTTNLATTLRGFGGVVLALSAERHRAVHDKLRMFRELRDHNLETPQTVELTDTEAVLELAQNSKKLVVKDRFGSGSSGLVMVDSARIEAYLQWLRATRSPAELSYLIAQPFVAGAEYGLDVVAPLVSSGHEVAVLARRKWRMRSGETDQAETVEPNRFAAVANSVAAWTDHRGLIDVDVLVDPNGIQHVIDINPRFGGGYPFNHLAGADVPGLYVATIAGKAVSQNWATYVPGFRSAKHESVVDVTENEGGNG